MDYLDRDILCYLVHHMCMIFLKIYNIFLRTDNLEYLLKDRLQSLLRMCPHFDFIVYCFQTLYLHYARFASTQVDMAESEESQPSNCSSS